MPAFSAHFGPSSVAESVYANWRTPNIQIITGAKSPTPQKIIVVDCDGSEALDRWNQMQATHGPLPRTIWISITGGGGLHYWFSLPDSCTECPSGQLWGVWDTWGDDGRGKWEKHKEVRLLADGCLVVAPPSVHVATHKRYRFHDEQNPKRILLPAEAPAWLLAMPRLQKPSFVREHRPPPRPAPVRYRYGQTYNRDEVIQAIPDKLALVKSWGLMTAGDPGRKGWTSCYVPGREMPGRSTPSGSFNVHDGTLVDHKDMTTISFLDLAVALGAYVEWRSARDDLGARFLKKFG